MMIPRPIDGHVHFRDHAMLTAVAPLTARDFAAAVVMPNLTPPITTAVEARTYKQSIIDACRMAGHHDFQPLMTIYLTDDTKPDMIEQAHQAGVFAVKVYPRGMTTNSSSGPADLAARHIGKVLAAMSDLDMPLLIHGEHATPDSTIMDRESNFLPMFVELIKKFDKLRVVLEHVSTKAGVEMIKSARTGVAATITLHHLICTLDDVIGTGTRPHNMCMPVPKNPGDRRALQEVVFDGHPRFMLGSDSAPHLRIKKESGHGSCGVFSAPVLLPGLAEIFNTYNVLGGLAGFTSGFFREFHKLPATDQTIELYVDPWMVPAEIAGVVPFWSGETLEWRVA